MRSTAGQHVLVTGASGMIGRALTGQLVRAGYTVHTLRRDTTQAPFHYLESAGKVSLADDIPLYAVINLAGPSLAAGRWTAARKAYLKSSRVNLTAALSRALAASPTPPSLLLSASAIGYYGATGAAIATEDSPAGNDFLAHIARDWERATLPAQQAGITTVHLRFGVVLSEQGGMLQRLLLPFRLGLGGRIGDGSQYLSWISLTDAVEIIQSLLRHPRPEGPVNLVAEHPVTNADFTRELARVLHRPAVLPLPAVVARVLFGEMADALLLASSRVQSTRLARLGITLKHPVLATALRSMLERA